MKRTFQLLFLCFQLLLFITLFSCKSSFKIRTTEPLPNQSENMTKMYSKPEKLSNEEKASHDNQYLPDMQEQAALATNYLVKAQGLLHQKKHQEAINYVKKSLEAAQTADGIALMGSIYFDAGDTTTAINLWQQALKLDHEVAFEQIPGLQEWLKRVGKNNQN